MLSLGNKIVVLSAKGNDPDLGLLSCHAADTIAVQSGAVDYVSGRRKSPRFVSTFISEPCRTIFRTSVPVLMVPPWAATISAYFLDTAA